MPNGYTAVPNILPGNVTIGGNLTVSGNEIKLGSFLRKLRLQMISSGGAHIGVNLDRINASQDDAAVAGAGIQLDDATRSFRSYDNPAGAVGALTSRWIVDNVRFQALLDELRLGAALPFVRLFKGAVGQLGLTRNLGTDFATRDTAGVLTQVLGVFGMTGVQAGFTGDVVEHTVWSNTIPANWLQAFGGLRVTIFYSATTQGATASTFRLKFGGTIISSSAPSSAQMLMWDTVLLAAGATNSQTWLQRIHLSVTGTVFAKNASALDTTVDQVLSHTIQLGATTDNWTFNGIMVEALTPSGAALT